MALFVNNQYALAINLSETDFHFTKGTVIKKRNLNL